MLVDGREVSENDVRQAMKIQQAVNAAEEMESSAQSEIDPKKAEKHFNELTSGLDQSDFNLFFDDTEFGDNSRTSADRKSRYEIYSEMDTMEFIHRGLELIADDSSQPNDMGDVIKVYSDDEAIKEAIEDLMIHRLDMNNELWSIIYETIKLGDNFYEVIPDSYKKPKEIRRIRYLEPQKVERVEVNGKLSHFNYKTEKKDKTEKIKIETQEYKLFPWQILHFKIESKENAPYGGSLLSSGVRTYRRLVMLEDIMLVYRISRAPERRVFYIDVGNLNPVEAKRFLTKMKNSYRSQSFIDENGNINKKANVMSITSDIFVPVREGSTGTRIDTLQAGQAMGASGSEDPLLKYFKDKILKTMNIPPQYMGEQSDRSRSLSQLDTKFGRFIERVQAQVTKGLNKLAALELFFKGFKKEDLYDFKIELTPPSNVKEITEIDIFNQRMALIGTIQSLQLFPNKWILKRILKLSDKEIADIEMQRTLEQTAQGQPGAEAGGVDMAAIGGPDLMGGAEGGGAEAGAEGGGAEAGAEGGGEEAGAEELAASTMINILGKDFIVENKDDFFAVVNQIKKEQKPEKMLAIFENVADILQKGIEIPEKVNKNNIEAQMAIHELKGLDFDNREVIIYEQETRKKEDKGIIQEVVEYSEKRIKCSSDLITE